MSPRAVVVGPGRIGCGLAGPLLADAGFEVTFLGRGAAIAQLARARRFRVRLTGGPRPEEREYLVADAHALGTDDAAAALAAADLVVVAVGPANLAAVAPALAAGLARRATPVNVLAFENDPEAGAKLRLQVGLRLPPGRPAHGFSGAVVSRIVARRIGDVAGSTPLVFVGDAPADVVVHGPSLVAPLPALPCLRAVDDLDAWFARKLFVFSAGHAAAAYLGALKGYHYVHSAIRDREIRRDVRAAMDEGRRGLLAAHGPEVAPPPEELDAILARFENAALNDPVARVGRDPRRKLGRADRLVGAARLAERAGVCPRVLSMAAAAALCFVCPTDPSACALQAALAAGGLDRTLRELAGVAAGETLGRLLADGFRALGGGRALGACLLSLDRRVWSHARPGAERRSA
jgi:mannitol-1-phosphate 5-dehydrogenase